jgi:hypothetical protein
MVKLMLLNNVSTNEKKNINNEKNINIDIDVNHRLQHQKKVIKQQVHAENDVN